MALVSMVSMNPESYMFHYPAVQWSRLQAEAMELPMVVHETHGRKEEELDDLKTALSELKALLGLEAVVSGAVASEYQKTRVDRICEEVGLRSFAPLWHKNPEDLLREVVDLGFEVIITSCSAMGFKREWLGKRLDGSLIEEIKELNRKFGVHMAFEGGEAETFVLDGPIFMRRLNVVKSKTVWSGDSGYLMLEDVSLSQKPSP